MKAIRFTKLVGAGNDFLLVDNRTYRISGEKKLACLAKAMCQRIFGAGADGLLILEHSRKADVGMRIFNADGSEAEMCGNGARCFAYYFSLVKAAKNDFRVGLETKAGI